MFKTTTLDADSSYTVHTQVQDRIPPFPITYREYSCAICGMACGITREVINGECGIVRPCRHSYESIEATRAAWEIHPYVCPDHYRVQLTHGIENGRETFWCAVCRGTWVMNGDKTRLVKGE